MFRANEITIILVSCITMLDRIESEYVLSRNGSGLKGTVGVLLVVLSTERVFPVQRCRPGSPHNSASPPEAVSFPSADQTVRLSLPLPGLRVEPVPFD
jgi:hypothetical protein